MSEVEVNGSELNTEISSADPNAEGSAPESSQGQANASSEAQQAAMRMQDYTRKTQALAEQRRQFQQEQKHWQTCRDNLSYDLDKVKRGQASVEEFKRIYHKDFHKYVDQLQLQNQNKPTSHGEVDPAFLGRINQIEQHFHQMEVNAISKELDAKFATMSQKYNLADEDVVISIAQNILNQKEKNGDNEPITDSQWNQIWKMAHDSNLNRFKQYQGTLVKGQKTRNATSKDAGAGGGTPGQSPRTAKTIKEATEMLMSDLESA